MYTDVLHRLRTEIMDYVGPERRPTYDDIRDMKYLRAFINGEVLDICSRHFRTLTNPL